MYKAGICPYNENFSAIIGPDGEHGDWKLPDGLLVSEVPRERRCFDIFVSGDLN